MRVPSIRQQTFSKLKDGSPITHRDLVECTIEELEQSDNCHHDEIEQHIRRAEVYARLAQSMNG